MFRFVAMAGLVVGQVLTMGATDVLAQGRMRGRIQSKIQQRIGTVRQQVTDAIATNPELVQLFDKNGNGRLDPDELQEARQRGQEIMKRFDKNGNGRLDPDEREAAKKSLVAAKSAGGGDVKAKVIDRFDKDGDGKLSEAERAEARKAFESKKAQ